MVGTVGVPLLELERWSLNIAGGASERRSTCVHAQLVFTNVDGTVQSALIREGVLIGGLYTEVHGFIHSSTP